MLENLQNFGSIKLLFSLFCLTYCTQNFSGTSFNSTLKILGFSRSCYLCSLQKNNRKKNTKRKTRKAWKNLYSKILLIDKLFFCSETILSKKIFLIYNFIHLIWPLTITASWLNKSNLYQFWPIWICSNFAFFFDHCFKFKSFNWPVVIIQ